MVDKAQHDICKSANVLCKHSKTTTKAYRVNYLREQDCEACLAIVNRLRSLQVKLNCENPHDHELEQV